MNLIDKSALVAEIEKIRKALNLNLRHDQGVCDGLHAIQKYINTLEVKEVDLETEQRIKDCPFRTVYCERFEGTIVECNGKCSRVVDYLKLKELKAQKGDEL